MVLADLQSDSFDTNRPKDMSNYNQIAFSARYGLEATIASEAESHPEAKELVRRTLDAIKNIYAILHTLNGDHPEKDPQVVSLQPPAGVSIDQQDILQLIADNPNMDDCATVLMIEYLAQIAFNQVKTSPQNTAEMTLQSAVDYEAIDPIISRESTNYTKAEEARRRYLTILQNLGLDAPEIIHLIAGTGTKGETEVQALIEAGVPPKNIFGTELLNLALIGRHAEVSDYGIALFDNTDVLALLQTINEPTFDVISSLGSSLVNHRGFFLLSTFFLFASRALKDNGHIIYETRNFEVLPDINSAHKQALTFGQQHPEMPYGAKGVHPDYQHKENAPDGFGAQLHSYAFIRALAHLAGFSFVEETLEDPKRALEHLKNPDLQNSPTWQAGDGIYRTFYTLKKTRNPHPILEHIIKYYFLGFESRADAADPMQAAEVTEMPEQTPDSVSTMPDNPPW